MAYAYRAIAGMLLLLCFALVALACRLTASTDSPAWTVRPMSWGRPGLAVRVAPLLRAATSPLGLRLLDGHALRTRFGIVEFTHDGNRLIMQCSPCTFTVSGFAAQPISIPLISIAAERQGNRLAGSVLLAKGTIRKQINFQGRLTEQGLALDWVLEQGKIDAILALLYPAVPEAEYVTVLGTLSAHGTLQLPEGKWSVIPQITGLEVYGLGTERLRYGHFAFACRDDNGVPHLRSAGDGVSGWATLQGMGRWLPRAVLAAEDAQFYQHPGYDMTELLPLLANTDRARRRGASTITQQLAKNFFVGADARGTRKIRELLYAVEMERTLGKQRILMLYLNTADWGPGICGISNASQRYFGKPPGKLSAVDAAWLAGILRNPHRAYRQEYLTGTVDSKRLAWVASHMRLPAPVARQFTQPQFAAANRLPSNGPLIDSDAR